LIVVAYVCAFAARIALRKYYIFLPDYARWAMGRSEPAVSAATPTHVFFFVVDHFEPGGDQALVRAWIDRYMALATRHHDAAGRVLQHTWFYPGEQYNAEILRQLQQPVAAGYGEVELHYHHGYDTEATLRSKLTRAIAQFQQFGFLKTVDGKTAWAFIHGNSGLDNSDGAQFCGVSTELQLLHELGCFADFTFPALYRASQPPFVNRIYMAQDDPAPKSYARALPLDAPGDLLIFEGPLVLAPGLNVRRLFVDVEDGNIHAAIPPSRTRMDRWVSADIHVTERPDWTFVKTSTHGAQSPGDMDAVLGPAMDDALTYLEQRYNDGAHYVLHYVTAREAYNLVRAAAAHAKGDPAQYLDGTVKRYVADGRRPLS
jgi:hypothetical protein